MELLPHGIDRGRPQTPRDHVGRAPTSILGPRGTTPGAGRRAPGKDSNQGGGVTMATGAWAFKVRGRMSYLGHLRDWAVGNADSQ